MGKMPPNLERLEELTEHLPDLSALVGKRGQSVVNYRIEAGHCVGIGLLNQPSVAVTNSLLTPSGATFPRHRQPVTEWLIVYEGRLRATRNGEEPIELGPGDGICFPPNVPHTVTALETTWLIGISVPASPGYATDDR